MLDKSVFHGVHVKELSQQQKSAITRSSVFLKEKYLSNGQFDKLKGRLVAGGHFRIAVSMTTTLRLQYRRNQHL